MKLPRFEEILTAARTKRILVIGDLMLDEFVWGKVGRISPEAPVPVVEVTRESSYPGGAANVARNLRGFVGETGVIGLLGADRGGRELRRLLEADQIDTSGAIEDAQFPTIVKTRIIARQQQVVRVDRERVTALSEAQVAEAVAGVTKQLPRTDAIILEDYGKGFLGADLVTRISKLAQAAGKIVTVDPNPTHLLDWKNVTAVKPNRLEAFQAAGIPWNDPIDPPLADEALLHVGEVLLKKWDSGHLLITLGEQGMILFDRASPPHHIPTKARQVFDVSGAGDTAIAFFTLALSCGGTAVEAAEIANHASAIVVAKLGTATVTPEELHASLEDDGTA